MTTKLPSDLHWLEELNQMTIALEEQLVDPSDSVREGVAFLHCWVRGMAEALNVELTEEVIDA